MTIILMLNKNNVSVVDLPHVKMSGNSDCKFYKLEIEKERVKDLDSILNVFKKYPVLLDLSKNITRL